MENAYYTRYLSSPSFPSIIFSENSYIFLSTSIFHVYKCLEKCWKTRKLKIPSNDKKKKKIIDQINKHISKKARILHIYLSISRDIIFDEKIFVRFYPTRFPRNVLIVRRTSF